MYRDFEQMAGALAMQLEVLDQRTVEEHHRLRGQRAVLGRAERQHVDAGTPGDVARVAVEKRHRIGESRPIHPTVTSAEDTTMGPPPRFGVNRYKIVAKMGYIVIHGTITRYDSKI